MQYQEPILADCTMIANFLAMLYLRKVFGMKGKTIFDVVDDLEEGDVILKGANSLDFTHKKGCNLYWTS